MRKKSDIYFYAIGTIAQRLVSLATVPLFSFFLTKDELGLYDLLFNSINLLVPVISLKLGVACFRSVRVEADASKKTDIIKTILVFSAFYHLILLLFLWLISPYFELNYKFPFLIIVFLSSFFTILGSIARSLYNRKALIFSGIVNSIGILIFSSLLFYLGKKGIEPIIYANILMNCLTISILIFFIEIA